MPFTMFNWFNISNRLHNCIMCNKGKVLKLAFQYGKKNGVVMPESWVKNEYASNMCGSVDWETSCDLCLKPEGTCLNHENVEGFF